MMRSGKAQLTLGGIFFLSLLINIVLLLAVLARGSIYEDNFQDLVRLFLTIYSGPMAIILGGYFAQRQESIVEVPRAPLGVAAALSLLWNLLLVSRSFIFTFAEEDSVEAFAAYVRDVSAGSMFLVAGALAYFFSRKTD